MNLLSIVFPYWNNPKMLVRQQQEWETYHGHNVQIVVVDDCSDTPAREVLLPMGGLKVFRMRKRLNWNQHGCRNFGASIASGPWLLMLDMDNIAPLETIKGIIDADLYPRKYYTFLAKTPQDVFKLPGTNKFLMHRDAFISTGMYDEDLCGLYGGDGEFFCRANAILKNEQLAYPLIHFSETDIWDAKTHDLPRKSPVNTAAKQAIIAIKQKYGIPPARFQIDAYEEVL